MMIKFPDYSQLVSGAPPNDQNRNRNELSTPMPMNTFLSLVQPSQGENWRIPPRMDDRPPGRYEREEPRELRRNHRYAPYDRPELNRPIHNFQVPPATARCRNLRGPPLANDANCRGINFGGHSSNQMPTSMQHGASSANRTGQLPPVNAPLSYANNKKNHGFCGQSQYGNSSQMTTSFAPASFVNSLPTAPPLVRLTFIEPESTRPPTKVPAGSLSELGLIQSGQRSSTAPPQGSKPTGGIHLEPGRLSEPNAISQLSRPQPAAYILPPPPQPPLLPPPLPPPILPARPLPTDSALYRRILEVFPETVRENPPQSIIYFEGNSGGRGGRDSAKNEHRQTNNEHEVQKNNKIKMSKSDITQMERKIKLKESRKYGSISPDDVTTMGGSSVSPATSTSSCRTILTERAVAVSTSTGADEHEKSVAPSRITAHSTGQNPTIQHKRNATNPAGKKKKAPKPAPNSQKSKL